MVSAMRGYKTRGNASRDNRGRAVLPPTHPTYPTHPDRATRLVGLIAAGALGGLGGGLAVGFATVPGSGLSVAAAHHDILAATASGSGARREVPASVMLTSLLSPAFVAPMPSPSPTPTNPNKPVPTTSPSATLSPTPGDPNSSVPLPTASATPTPTKSTSTGKRSSSGRTSSSRKTSTGSKTSSSGSNAGALNPGSAGAGETPLVNVPGVSPVNPTGLFPTVSPGSGSAPGAKGKRIEAVTTAATTPLDTLIPGQVVGLAVLIGAIALAFVRFSLRTSPPSDSQGKSQ
jgi:hypothetical protein